MQTWTQVAGALLYLRVKSLQNLLLSRLRRLRQPKYLVGAVVGLAYIYFMFVRRFTQHRAPMPGVAAGGLGPNAPALASILGATALLLFIALCWTLRRSRAALSFSEAEIAFLFPAPITRRVLVNFRLITLGLTVMVTALILATVSTPWPFIAPAMAMRLIGWWLVFSTLSLHVIGSAFTLTRCVDRGIPPLRSQLVAIVLAALVIVGPIAWLWHATPAGEMPALADVQRGPVGWVLWPFQLMIAPLLAIDWHGYVIALAPALLIYAAHYAWVLQVQVSFEEGSMAKAEKRAATRAAMRAGNFRLGSGRQKARRAPFDLSRAWRPEFAFLWKNLLASAEYLRLRNALIIAALIIFSARWFADSLVYQGLQPVLVVVVLVIAAYTVVLGPQLARQDFRSDLPNTDILKTYPLHGWQVLLGELLAPAVVLTGVIWLMLLAGVMFLPSSALSGLAWLTPTIRIVIELGCALAAPLLCVLQLLVLNAAAVLFPAWSQAAVGRAQQGIEVTGQRIFFVAGQLLMLAVMLVPATFLASLAFLLSRWIIGDAFAAGFAALLVVAVLAAEIAGGIWWLGQRFERLDLSDELRP